MDEPLDGGGGAQVMVAQSWQLIAPHWPQVNVAQAKLLTVCLLCCNAA